MQTRLPSQRAIVVVQAPVPSISGPGQVVVRNVVSTICGSDVHVIFDAPLTVLDRPGYPGHESVAVVVDSSDPAIAVDDLVLAVPGLLHAGGFVLYQSC